MKPVTKIIAGVVALITLGLLQFPVFAQEKAGHSHEKAEAHGGEVLMSKRHHFEVVFRADGIDVYLYDGVQKPLAAKGVEGKVTLRFKDGKSTVLPLVYVAGHMEGEHAAMEEHHEEMAHDEKKEHGHAVGGMQMDHLQARVDLSKLDAGSMKATFELQKLASKEEPAAKFTATFKGLSGQKAAHEHEEGHKH